MRFFSKQVVPVLLVGALACGSVLGFQNDLPADYSPEITYCPPGLEAFKNAHTVALAEAAMACSEMDLLADAFLFFQASEARSAIDRRLLVPEDALEEQTAFETRARALRFKFGSRFTVADAKLAIGILNAYSKVFEWSPQVEGYDPGFSVEIMPPADLYHQLFRMAVANSYARHVQSLYLDLDPEYAELRETLQRLTRSDPRPDHFEMQSLAAPAGARRKALMKTFIEEFEPTIVEGRIVRYGLFESFDEIEQGSNPAVADGTRSARESIVFHERSLVVPAEIGLQFGFDFKIAGVVQGTEDRLTVRIIHPPMPNSDSILQTVSTRRFASSSRLGRVEEHVSYRFSEPHQLLPGNWTLQVVYFDRIMLSKTFEVIEVDG